MIGAIVGIIFAVIIVGVLIWALQQLAALVPMPEPFHTIVRVLIVLVCVLLVLWIIAQLLGMIGVGVPGFGRL